MGVNVPPLRVGLAGLGTVAQALLELLRQNQGEIARRARRPIQVIHVASRTPRPNVDLLGASFGTDLDYLVESEVDVIVELIGSPERAQPLIADAIRKEKAVITGNKAVLAEDGNELFQMASEGGMPFGFEAAVAGGIPIILTLKDGLNGNQIQALAGIINGTCNYILSEMATNGTDFDKALANAQSLGYAEADPTLDVSGMDAAQKLAILGSICFDVRCDVEQVYVEGIEGVTGEDLEYAHELGYKVRHLGILNLHDDALEARVHPTLIQNTHLLANIDGVENAISIQGNGIGSMNLTGPGAGGPATASAVLSDLICLAQGKLSVPQVPSREHSYQAIDRTVCPHYLYIPALDEPGVIATIGEVFSIHDVSIESVIQKQDQVRDQNGSTWVPIVIVTNSVEERQVKRVISTLTKDEHVCAPIRHIRVANL